MSKIEIADSLKASMAGAKNQLPDIMPLSLNSVDEAVKAMAEVLLDHHDVFHNLANR